MFVSLSTTKDEKIFLNVDKISFFAETKKGVSVVLDDGTLIDLAEDYDDLLRRYSLLKIK